MSALESAIMEIAQEAVSGADDDEMRAIIELPKLATEHLRRAMAEASKPPKGWRGMPPHDVYPSTATMRLNLVEAGGLIVRAIARLDQ